MRTLALLDAGSAQILGFDWLRNAVTPVSPYGERLFSEMQPFAPGQESAAQARSRQIAAVAAALDADRVDAARAALADAPDVAPPVARATIGDVLDDAAFLELRRFAAVVARVDALVALAGQTPIFNDALSAIEAALAAGGPDDRRFYLADSFDSELGDARERLARDQAELDVVRGRESAQAARSLGREALEADEFIVMRADLRGALPIGVRIIREAPTYLLCELEYGESALAALARRDAAAEAVADLEERVRIRLSALVRSYSAGLDAAAQRVGGLDVLLAAVRFTQRHRCEPASVEPRAGLAFQQGRFLPLEDELGRAGRHFVPLDLDLYECAVLTGPNMGGKSVTLQTCGFVALCTAFGLPAPARQARCALFDQLAWLGLGRDAHIGGLLSSFAHEVLELRSILARNSARLLLLADEFARTTTPQEGKAITIALLERLRDRGAVGMFATHLGGIAAAAGARHFAVRGLREIPHPSPAHDITEALAALGEAMDYTITEVTGPQTLRADALALALLLGVDQAFVDAAYRALAQ